MARYSTRIRDDHMVAVRFSSLGDVVLTTGVLLHRHALRGTEFTVVTRSAFAPVFEGNPAVREVIGLTDEELHGQGQAMAFRMIVDKYRNSPLLDLHRNLRSAMLARSWKDAIICYRKMAFARRVFLMSGGRWFGDALRSLNIPQRYAAGLYGPQEIPSAEELRPRIFLSEAEKSSARERLAPLRNKGRIAAIHPFAAHAAKTWPAESWMRLAAALEAQGISCLWLGRGDDFTGAGEPASLINKTDLRELSAVLAESDILITGDSGPMHLATAAGTPVLALFGPTTREWGFFPSGERDRVLECSLPCRPCSLHGSARCPRGNACTGGISMESVLGNALEMLGL